MNSQKINLVRLAASITAMHACQKSEQPIHKEWEVKHKDSIDEIIGDLLPHGSGIDNGVVFDYENSNANKLIFSFGFHHMNENGYYDGWTDHKLIITPAFGNFHLKITGKDRNQIKGYLYDLFFEVFTAN